QTGVKCLIGSDFILSVFAFPKTSSAQANVPVRQIFLHKIRNGSCCTGWFVRSKTFIHFFGQCVEFRQYPAVYFRSVCQRNFFFAVRESVNISIQGKERISVVQSAEKLTTNFCNSF